MVKMFVEQFYAWRDTVKEGSIEGVMFDDRRQRQRR